MAGLRHVQSGQPMRIPAADWNRVIDATRAHYEALGTPRPVPSMVTSKATIRVKNTSGDDLERFSAAAISGVLIDPADNAEAFAATPGFTVATPVVEDVGTGRIVITAEPVVAGSIGRAYASGVCIAKIDVTDEAHTHADVADGTTTITSTFAGPLTILWKETGTGVVFALVRFGEADPLVPVQLTQTGGLPGDKDNQCSFTYTVRDLAGNELATGVDPIAAPHAWRRMPRGQYLAATAGLAVPGGTPGADGTVALYWINEVPNANACQATGGAA
jgi:hypothetical protein